MAKTAKKRGNYQTVAEYVNTILGVKDAPNTITRWDVKYQNNEHSLVGMRRAATLIKMHRDMQIRIILNDAPEMVYHSTGTTTTSHTY